MEKLKGAMMKKYFTGIILIMFLTGCASEKMARDPEYAAVRPAAMKPQEYSNGAIYQAGYDIRLYEDPRARRVGDIITIILTEQTDASKSATTSLEKDTNNTITNPTILGSTPSFNVPGVLPLESNRNNNLGTSLGSAHDFEGEGKSAQSNSLTGNISVTVVEVLPNGNLVIRGEKIISLNQGDEYVRVAGIVRAQDVTSKNTVLSTQIADAHISYGGNGMVADSNKLGWLARFFVSAIMPF
ncbi:MAG: flagellar basal body L-ring protein FlgH [Gammaproteobacteria bacterium]|nr:flagellar basal body L-ring protein FlgH [Gammaproteobacteria bacterium]